MDLNKFTGLSKAICIGHDVRQYVTQFRVK